MKKLVAAFSVLALSGCSVMDMVDQKMKAAAQQAVAEKAAADRAAAQKAAADRAAAQKAAADRAAAQKAAADRAAAQKAAADRAAAQKAAADRAAAQKAAADRAAAQKAAADRAAAQKAAADRAAAAPRVLTDAERFQAAVEQLATQLNQNMGRRTGQKFILTSFTDLERISQSSGLGQMLSENLINQLQIRGWDLVELRLSNAVSVNKAGEFGLSREHRRLKEQFQASGIVTGTYSVAGRYVLVNARVMNFETGAVVSSAQVRLPMTAFVEELAYAGRQSTSIVKIMGGMESR